MDKKEKYNHWLEIAHLQKLNQDDSKALLDKTKEAFAWLKSQVKL